MTEPFIDTLSQPRSADFGEVRDAGLRLLGSVTAQETRQEADGARSALASAAERWLKYVEDNIGTLPAAEALSLVCVYDLLHRIVRRALPGARFIHKYVMNALTARAHGDTSVDPYELYRMIETGLRTDFDLYKGKALDWQASMLSRWYREFRTGRYCPMPGTPAATDADIRNRVAILLDADLWAFDPNPASFKHRLLANHAPALPSFTAPLI